MRVTTIAGFTVLLIVVKLNKNEKYKCLIKEDILVKRFLNGFFFFIFHILNII